MFNCQENNSLYNFINSVMCIRGMDTSKRAHVLLFLLAKLLSESFFVHGWEFILRESVYYGKKEQFYLIPFLCPVWNIAADYFRPITFSVPGTEVMVEKILSLVSRRGLGWSPEPFPSLSQSPQLCPVPASLLPSSQTDLECWWGNQFLFLRRNCQVVKQIWVLWDCQMLNQRLKR